MRTLLLSLVLVTSALASVADARSRRRSIEPTQPAVIFPSAGRLPPEPQIWVGSAGAPELEITSGGWPVRFTIDSIVHQGDGMRWAAVHVELESGAFTVKTGRTRTRFTIDPSLARRDSAIGDEAPPIDSVEFERMAIDRADMLTIDARARRGTVLYFLNHEVEEGASGRYVWIGPGLPVNGLTRFELPLARLGMSCAGAGSITLSLYSTEPDGTTTLYPFSELTVERGRVKLPVEYILQQPDDKRWLPCPGAAVRAGQLPGPPDPTDRAELPLARQVALSADALAGAQLDSRSTSWPRWWNVLLAIAAVLCARIVRRSPAGQPT